MCMYPHEEPYARPGLGSRNLIQAKEYCCNKKLLNSVENTTETPWLTMQATQDQPPEHGRAKGVGMGSSGGPSESESVQGGG